MSNWVYTVTALLHYWVTFDKQNRSSEVAATCMDSELHAPESDNGIAQYVPSIFKNWWDLNCNWQIFATKICLYFLQNVWKYSIFKHTHSKFSRSFQDFYSFTKIFKGVTKKRRILYWCHTHTLENVPKKCYMQKHGKKCKKSKKL